MRSPAVVMNMYYTGLGIARSLGEHGVPVIGLTAQKRVYGSFTRYAKRVLCPDSRTEPERLFEFLIEMSRRVGERMVIFPTRDDDVLFLDRYREKLAPYFVPVVPERNVIEICLDKWQTYLWAQRTGVPTPQCWLINNLQELQRQLPEIAFPCVLKPVSAYAWRQGANWQVVGGRKAVAVTSSAQLLEEYAVVSHADPRVLLQELIPGGDERLVIAAGYLDRESNWVAGFNTRKLLQVPDGFGTGCIVQATHSPQLIGTAGALLRTIGFSGIAEVEFKWNDARSQYQLIEINPRPWDQHRLGRNCGADLAFVAYCDYAGMARPTVKNRQCTDKWIAEDAFLDTALRLLWRRDPKLRTLFHLAGGKRIYAIWSARDPLPFLAYSIMYLFPRLITAAMRAVWIAFKNRFVSGRLVPKKSALYE